MVENVEPIDVHNCLWPSLINPLDYRLTEILSSLEAAVCENGETSVINCEYV